MRRTLAVIVAAGAFLVPAGAASAAETEHANASCNNMKAGNYKWTGHTYNGGGRVLTDECVSSKRPVKDAEVGDTPGEVPPGYGGGLV